MQRPAQEVSIFIVTVMLSSWLAISNHCALGLAVPEKAASKASPNECPFHAKQASPVKPKSQSTGSPCCKVLRAIAANPAKNVAQMLVDLGCTNIVFPEVFASAPPITSFDLVVLDTGPPGSHTISLLIKSMRAHAPPSLG